MAHPVLSSRKATFLGFRAIPHLLSVQTALPSAVWMPESNPFPFPDCTAVSRPRKIVADAEMAFGVLERVTARDELYKNRSSRKIDSQRLFFKRMGLPEDLISY